MHDFDSKHSDKLFNSIFFFNYYSFICVFKKYDFCSLQFLGFDSIVTRIRISEYELFLLSTGRNRSKFINAAEYKLYFDIEGLVSINTGWLKFTFVIWMFATILNRMLTLFSFAAAR